MWGGRSNPPALLLLVPPRRVADPTSRSDGIHGSGEGSLEASQVGHLWTKGSQFRLEGFDKQTEHAAGT
jgi:hypothetical protein